jgi:hypothetical protein
MTDTHAQQQAARRKRDARIRWAMLNTLHMNRASQAGGWITGRGIVESLGYCGPDFKFDTPGGDGHAMGLLQDLATAGYAMEEDNREDNTQPFGLDHLTYKITAKGIGFVNRTEAPDGLIDDGRIIKH